MRRRVVGILRGFTVAEVEGIVPACIKGGLRHLEITMNSPGACDLIRLACRLSDGRMEVGAGTVLNEWDLEAALSSGARFIVTPVVNPTVIRACVRLKMPVYPGAYSPSEVFAAADLGADMVKVFPADGLGPAYLRVLKETFPMTKLMPTGGVSLETIQEFEEAGADGFGVGSPLFTPERIKRGDWGWLEDQCRRFVHG